ncbi:DNA-binding LacI/PurR family transcriptional regulator [Streptacidiphilus sp. MAP12-20]|uniref:LacI family DNA-binding transcriptional regulator n=1 Tax=Streptacidiphilus sp. MAP12-20 TaxID=3156299 RepID=UPI0035132A2B
MPVTGHTRADAAAPPEGEQRKAASIRDVARVAGVSHQTVSRVINDHPSVRPETRDRVHAVIAQLGFRRSATALALAGGPVRAVTVLTSNTTLYGYAATLQGVEEEARAAGFSVGVSVLDSDEDADIDRALAAAADSGGGVLVIAYDRIGAAALERVPSGLACTAAVESPAGGRIPARPSVWADDRAAAREATAHLLGLGHATVHYVAIPSSSPGARRPSPRAAGWREALQDAGVTPPKPCGKGWDARAGYQAGLALARDPTVTAVLCGNDDLALGVLRALHEAGRSVPGDVSVIGFDDAPHSAYLTPSLSSVRMDFTGIGRAAFALLRDQLDPPGAAARSAVEVAKPELVLRESSLAR